MATWLYVNNLPLSAALRTPRTYDRCPRCSSTAREAPNEI